MKSAFPPHAKRGEVPAQRAEGSKAPMSLLPMTPPPACAKPKWLRFGEGRSPYDGDTSPCFARGGKR